MSEHSYPHLSLPPPGLWLSCLLFSLSSSYLRFHLLAEKADPIIAAPPWPGIVAYLFAISQRLPLLPAAEKRRASDPICLHSDLTPKQSDGAAQRPLRVSHLTSEEIHIILGTYSHTQTATAGLESHPPGAARGAAPASGERQRSLTRSEGYV